jgi:hypothetical protein
MTSADKQDMLSKFLVENVQKMITPLIEEIAELKKEMAVLKQDVSLGFSNVLLRMETIDKLVSCEKKTVKTTSRKKTEETEGEESVVKTKKPKKDKTLSDPEKVKNAMQYCRYARAFDPEDLSCYISEETESAFESDESIAAKPKGSVDRAYAEGMFLWKSVLTSKQQDEVRNKYKQWILTNKKNTEEPQLELDDAETGEK